MNTAIAFIVLASITNGGPLQTSQAVNPQAPEPLFRSVPKPPEGLTLYNAKGEIVAHCGRKDDAFSNCKMEPGVTLDDLMNAWVHAYQDSQK